MQTKTDYHRSFVIAGDAYIIRPAQPDDFEVDLTFCKCLPDATETSINFGLKPDTEKLNLFGIYDVNDVRSSAFVAAKVDGGSPNEHKQVGYAMYAKNRERYSHEFYISLDQSLKQSTLPAQLLSVLVQHAKVHGVKVLFCHADENNTAMREMAERVGMLVTLESEQSHGVKYTLILDNHPDILQVLAS